MERTRLRDVPRLLVETAAWTLTAAGIAAYMGLRIDFLAIEGNSSKVLKSVTTNADGRPPDGPLMTPETIKSGRYQAVLHIADYYRAIGAKLPDKFHTKLILEFDITNDKQPHHLPFQITPWTQSASVLPG